MRASKTGFDGEETRFMRYRYDGQMGIEHFETRDNNQVNGVRSVLTQYGLGARGIDWSPFPIPPSMYALQIVD